jgi:hypothetical protein
VREQLLARPTVVALSLAHLGRQPCRELLGVLDRTLPEPEMLPDLAAMPLDRAPVPVVQPELGRRHLHLVGDEPDHPVGQLGSAARETAELDVVLEQQREPEEPGTTLAREQGALVVQNRPVLNQLVELDRWIHGPPYFPTQRPADYPSNVAAGDTFLTDTPTPLAGIWSPVTSPTGCAPLSASAPRVSARSTSSPSSRPLQIIAEVLGYCPATIELHARGSAVNYASYIKARLDARS